VIASILIASFPEKSFVFKPAERLANGSGQRQSQFHVSELISQVLFAQKSALPPFSQGDLKISLCKGRFRGILICSTRLGRVSARRLSFINNSSNGKVRCLSI